jgi:flagellar basal body-associated protein FliL
MSAAASEEKSEAASAGSGASGGGGSKLVLILTGVNVLATLAMVAILFVSFQKDRKKPSVEDISAQASAEGKEAKGDDAKGEHGKEAKGEHGKEGEKKKSADYGKMVTLDQFTVNLSTPGSVNPKFVRVNISLEVPTEDTEGEVTSKMPQVRNVIIDLFNSKRPTDLATAEGREYLKEEIKNAINGFMVSGKVRGVYFTNFALSS